MYKQLTCTQHFPSWQKLDVCGYCYNICIYLLLFPEHWYGNEVIQEVADQYGSQAW